MWLYDLLNAEVFGLWGGFSSVQFLVMFDSLRPCGLQHARLPCPSSTPRTCWNSCPLSWWCHPTISSSVTPFSFCPQYFYRIRVFSLSRDFTSGDQSIGASDSPSVLPMNVQGWLPLGLTDLILTVLWNQLYYFFGVLKSLQMVTAAMKWKDAYSLEGKFWPT